MGECDHICFVVLLLLRSASSHPPERILGVLNEALLLGHEAEPLR